MSLRLMPVVAKELVPDSAHGRDVLRGRLFGEGGPFLGTVVGRSSIFFAVAATP